MQLDGFLTFGNGGFIIRLADGRRLAVAGHEKGQQLGIVVLNTFLLGAIPLNIGLLTVIIGIETSIERMPEARAGRILLG